MEGQDIQPLLRNMETHKAEQTPTLPEETIEEILSRLPVKSLLKFRCVSKSWRCLIGSKRFIKTHLENSTRNISFAHHRIILNSAPPYRTYDRLQQCSLNWLLNGQLTGPVTFDDSIKNRWESVSLVGCCNGLICILLNRRYFVLWNPSTRMSKKLPDIDDKIKRGHGLVTKHGFGCDESSGDYKVFGIVSDFFTYQAIGKVYSLKTNSWKIVKERDVSPISVAGKFASGKLHWASFRSGSGWDIVSFDLNSEIYGMIEQPCYPEGFRFRLSLGVVGGCLCMLCDDRETHLDVWVMKHYGVKESWNKVATVPHLHRPRIDQLSTLFYIGSNGEIILTCGSTFIIYSSKDNVFQCSRIMNSASFHEADIYIESLVSLVPDVKQEMQSRETVA